MKKTRPPLVVRIWSSYLASLATHPLATKSLTAALISGSGELTAALLRGNTTSISNHSSSLPRRMAALAAYGALFSAPLAHYFYLALDRLFSPALVPSRTTLPTSSFLSLIADAISRLVRFLTMTLIDQVTLGPLCTASILAWLAGVVHYPPSSSSTLSSLPSSLHARVVAARTTLSSQFWPTQFASWRLWPPATLLTYSLVPRDLRPLVLGLVGWGWNTLLVLNSTRTSPSHDPPSHSPSHPPTNHEEQLPLLESPTSLNAEARHQDDLVLPPPTPPQPGLRVRYAMSTTDLAM